MDASKLYVPDVTKWIDFCKNSCLQNKKRNNQFGGSIVGGIKTSIISIENKEKIKEPERKKISDVPIKIILPSQAVVEQAETEIKRQGLKKNRTSQSSQQR